jgi:Fe-S-cluster-containing hydrogenase component 2
VASIECSSCQDCVVACPVKGCLAVRPPRPVPTRRWLRPAAAVVLAVAIYGSVVVAFRVAGHWRTAVSEAEFHTRLQDIDSPAYVHPGGSR